MKAKILNYLSLLSLFLLTACVSTRPSLDDYEPLQPQYDLPSVKHHNQLPADNQPFTQKLNLNDTTNKLAQSNLDKNNNNNKNLTPDKLIETNLKAGKAQITGKQITQASKAAPSSWDLSGALAVRSRSKSTSASINWYQRGVSNYQIRLFGPLGSGTVMIAKRGGIITLQDGPKKASSANAEQLLLQQTGIRLPVNNLFYWVRGLPAPGAIQSAKRDAGNRLISLNQNGYIIQYLGYSARGKTILPTRIVLQGNGVFIKLVINRWST